MALAEGEIERVRVATDIVAIISERTALKRSGTRWVGLCPFHTERSGSFSVNAAEGFYYCFGCHAKGDAITFVRETQHLDFMEAVEFLAGRAGIELQHDEQNGAARQQRKRFLEVMDKAVEWYHEQLLTSPEAGPARNYLRSRGYTGETVRRFKLGWAPDSWDALTKALNLSAKDLDGTGLGFVNSRGNRQDALRARIIFPIFDTSNHAIAVGGRILPTSDPSVRPEAKYKNSPETPIYSKRRTLYALNWAKDDVVKKNEIIVCEGYTDVIAFFEAGFPRAVATCGTSLTEDHFKTMRNFAHRIVLAYDGDSAGQNAAASVYQWEHQFDAEVVVARFPEGVDPAELAQSNPEALGEALSNAVPFLQFRLERVLASANFSTPESRARAAEAALSVVAEHPSDLVRDQYLQAVADRCRMDVESLRPRLSAVRRGASAQPARESLAPRSDAPDYMAYKPGIEALRRLIHEPMRLEGRLSAAMFADPVHKTAYMALESGEPLVHCIDALNRRGDEWAAELLSVLAVEEPIEVASAEEDELQLNDLIAQLLRAAAQEALTEINRQMRDGTVTAESGLMVIRDVRQRMEHLGKPEYPSVEQELRDWLESMGESL